MSGENGDGEHLSLSQLEATLFAESLSEGRSEKVVPNGEDLLADAILGIAYAETLNEESRAVLREIYFALRGDPKMASRLAIVPQKRGRKAKTEPDDTDWDIFQLVQRSTWKHESVEAAVALVMQERGLARSTVFASLNRVRRKIRSIGGKGDNPMKWFSPKN